MYKSKDQKLPYLTRIEIDIFYYLRSEYLGSNPYNGEYITISYKELAEIFNCHPRTVARSMKKLLSTGLIKSPNKKPPYRRLEFI